MTTTDLYDKVLTMWCNHADRFARVINILEDIAEGHGSARLPAQWRGDPAGYHLAVARQAGPARNAVARALLASNKFFKRCGVDAAASDSNISLVGLSKAEALGLCEDYLREMARELELMVCGLADDKHLHDAGAKAVELLHRAEKALTGVGWR